VRTGLLGGTFDPIHIAHLHAAETALHAAGLDRVLFVPAGDPWQKRDRQVSPATVRAEMTRLAIDGEDNFELDTREIERGGPTFTADTLDTFPDNEDLLLILGADAASRIGTWERSGHVIDRAEILVVPRPGTDPEDVMAAIPSARILEMAPLGVSGTMIRRMAEQGRPFRYLVPGAVYTYIAAKNLYTDSENRDMVRETNETESSS
jgi:nicotinate-nucleotide adenylyltransferase